MKNTIVSRILPLKALCGLLLALSATTALADDYDDVASFMRAGKTAEAMARADQLLATRPRDPQMRFLKAMMLQGAGKPQEAIAIFTSLTQDYPELPEPHNNLAVLHAAQGDLDKARSALEMALRANPNYATAHENLGDVYLRLAAESFKRAQQLGNNSAALQARLKLLSEPALKGTPP
jgi:tetratricopeptide (TPR) repeat protein